MNAYLVRADINEIPEDYDYHDAHVIVANNEAEAVRIANEKEREPGPRWDYAEVAQIGPYNGPTKEPFIVLSSFNAG